MANKKLWLTEELMCNAIALHNAKKKGGEIEKDLNALFAEKNLTVDKMLQMNVADFVEVNAGEVMGEGNDGFGSQYVQDVILSGELIERLKAKGNLLSKINIKSMSEKAKSLDIPVRGKRVRMVLTEEVADAPTGGASDSAQVKKIQTPKITLTPTEMKITIYYSDTWLEDSVIAVAEYVLSAITDAYETSVYEILINGDTATADNTNINIVDGAISALPDGVKTDLLAFDGIRKKAFQKNAIVNAGANFVVENIRTARAKMGIKGMNPADLVGIPDFETYTMLLNLSEVETIEKFGPTATIKNGVLESIDGVKIEMREEMVRALATGKISATAASNVKGALAIVHAPSVYLGIKRGLTTENSRYAEDGVTGVTGTARLALTFDDTQNNVSPTSPCALIYNI